MRFDYRHYFTIIEEKARVDPLGGPIPPCIRRTIAPTYRTLAVSLWLISPS